MTTCDLNVNFIVPEKKPKVHKRIDSALQPASNLQSFHKNLQKNDFPKKGKFFKPNKDDVDSNKGKTSSLFHHNPEIPDATDFDVVPIEEPLFSQNTFKSLGVLHPHLVANLEQLFQITKMTIVQQLTIPPLLQGQDALVRSQTGSGKTLAYAVPIMQMLQSITPKIARNDGVKALIILPTRELALQTYECFLKLCRAFTWIVPGIIVGGEKKKSEKARLRKGINVLVGTPGRILDHAQHTQVLLLHKLDWLILDEADKLLDLGYERDIGSLVSMIKDQRDRSDEDVGKKQTVLLSATLGPGVERLAGLTLNKPLKIDASQNDMPENDALVIPHQLSQKYVVTPAKLRLVTLASFIVTICEVEGKSKVLIFMATQDMVDYYTDLIPSVITSNVVYFKLHGNMTQTDRVEVFNKFRQSDSGVLLCTDVGARGLDLPQVDWIVQFTAPIEPNKYVHRVGRTARVGTSGSSLLFLIPSELPFLQFLQEKRIKLEEVNMENYLKNLLKIKLESKDGQSYGSGVEGAATMLQHNFEHAVLNEKGLHSLACKAYRSWVRFYASYPNESRVAFNFKSLHLGHHAKCFALRDTPSVIGGIGKPNFKLKNRSKRKVKKDSLGLEAQASRTKRLITSEFDSGMPSKKRKT
ncbi:probable ATP-dependent RNA helicase DDX31 [Cimex lectularius]|uniref:ATP-dependent RNA helicase n=1 Tax=Cimex lectularius TaxID=79782 RepID=A0A8I6TI55_CIMLE|nr:probable ATP-dependent RNA helicase DDX31 [Cimex lectularius]